jgi:hypothetical protein
MSTKTDALGDLYVEVTGGETVTESQEEGPSRDPIDEETASVEAEVSRAVTEDGLDDTVEGIEADL